MTKMRWGMNGPGRISALLALCLAIGCSPVPRKYLRQAAPNVTLTTLSASPDSYQGRLVVLGGVIVEEEMQDGRLWLHVKNRPLDQDYKPQLPPSPDDPEGGPYWVVVEKPGTFPASHHHWADMIVVGRVSGSAPGQEPVLNMVYARGWGVNSAHDGVWEHVIDSNYLPSAPASAVGELGQK